MNNENKLHIGLQKLGFSTQAIQQISEKLTAYANELHTNNHLYGLTAIHDYDEIIVRHILDSLAAYDELQNIKNAVYEHETPFFIADIGSGGGIPGIPLAIAMSDIDFVLIERMAKRCAFLEHCVSALDLKNVTIENKEVERIEQNRFDIVVFRAFRPFEKKILRVLLRILKDNGVLLAYKGKKQKIEEEMASVAPHISHYSIKQLNVPFLEDYERHAVCIQKHCR